MALGSCASERDFGKALGTFVTQKEIGGLATKEDIGGLATKEEVGGLATKEDIGGLRRELEELRASAAGSGVVRLSDVEELERKLARLEEGVGRDSERLVKLRHRFASSRVQMRKLSLAVFSPDGKVESSLSRFDGKLESSVSGLGGQVRSYWSKTLTRMYVMGIGMGVLVVWILYQQVFLVWGIQDVEDLARSPVVLHEPRELPLVDDVPAVPKVMMRTAPLGA